MTPGKGFEPLRPKGPHALKACALPGFATPAPEEFGGVVIKICLDLMDWTSLETQKMPTQVAKKLKINLPHVGRALKELESRGLVKCLTPSERVGKLYVLTEGGKEVRKKIKGI